MARRISRTIELIASRTTALVATSVRRRMSGSAPLIRAPWFS